MRSLPRPAFWYLIALWGVALGLLGWALLHPPTYAQLAPLLIGLVAFVVCDYFEVTFEINEGVGVGMTVADAPLLFLAIVGGIPGALAVALGVWFSDLAHRRIWYRSLFNVAVQTITFVAMREVYTAQHPLGKKPFTEDWALLTFGTIAVVYYLCNTLLVGTMVALASNQPVRQVYRESFQSIHWVHLVTLPIGAIMARFWPEEPSMLILAALPLVMAQRAFTAVAGLQAESRRNEALAQEQTRLNQELQQRQEELLRSSKLAALGTFSAGIAHEFNNVLAAILGHAQLGLMNPDIAEKDYSLDVAVRVCQRGRSITSSLLTFARRREPQKGMNQVLDAVEETLALVEHELNKHNIQIVRRLQPVPLTLCDLGQIGQVMLNLLTNARDALREQGGGTITIDLSQADEQIVLAIADTGPGIPPHVLDQIFQPFVTTKAPGQGTGLGMAICYGIVEGHGGSIAVTSAVGQGATVTIRLPIIAAPPAAMPAHHDSASSLRILLVDDELEVAGALARLLEGYGHEVQLAIDGTHALQRYQPRIFDVVLSDAIMPGMSGAAFVRQIQMLDPGVPVLVITGYPDSPQVDEMLAAGAATVIVKPFMVEDVLAAIARIAPERLSRLGNSLPSPSVQ